MSFITVVCVIHDIWDAFENDFGSVEKCFPGFFLLLFFWQRNLKEILIQWFIVQVIQSLNLEALFLLLFCVLGSICLRKFELGIDSFGESTRWGVRERESFNSDEDGWEKWDGFSYLQETEPTRLDSEREEQKKASLGESMGESRERKGENLRWVLVKWVGEDEYRSLSMASSESLWKLREMVRSG